MVEKLKAARSSEREEGPRCTGKEQFPPPVSGGLNPSPSWLKLPPMNRDRVLVSLSRLLQRRLGGLTTSPKEGGEDDPGRSRS